MAAPDHYSYPRYLKAKRSVDARSLNQGVWTRFLNSLPRTSSDLRILEVGGGVGATFERIVSALESAECETLQYTLVDRNQDNIDAARDHIPQWAAAKGYHVRSGNKRIHLSKSSSDPAISLELVCADLFEFADGQSEHAFDAIIAQAVLDLLSLTDFFSSLRPLLTEDGLWYLPIHFDGVTGFAPPSSLDEKIERIYHESMNRAGEEGGRRDHTGRRLITVLRSQGDAIVSAGASDWVVFPKTDGYSEEEEYFLYHILHFIEEELMGHDHLESEVLLRWIQKRREQVRENELVYIAHQLDVLAKKKG